ncbi:MAG TPA: pilin glycosylation ligase domain-containing protein, partial [Rhodoferax sp.]
MGRFALLGHGCSISSLVSLIVALIFLSVSWLQPLHILPWVSWHSEAVAFLTVLLSAWYGLFVAVKKGNASAVSTPRTALPFIGLALLIWLQTAAGLINSFGDAVVFTLYLILCILCMGLGRASSSDPKTYDVLAGVLLLGAFLSAVVAFAQVLELWETSAWISRMPQLRRPGGNLGQPNQLATLLLMGLASLMFLYESKRLGALASALLAFTLLTGVAATESRTAILSLALLILWWF